MSRPTPADPRQTWRTVDELLVVDCDAEWATLQPATTLRVYRPADGSPVAMVTELAWNRGPSITNLAAWVWRAVARLLDTTAFDLVEYYGPESFADGGEPDHYAIVKLDARTRPGGGESPPESCTSWWEAHCDHPDPARVVPEELRGPPSGGTRALSSAIAPSAAVLLRTEPVQASGR